MGWLVSDRPLTHETPADYLTRHYTNETEEARSEVLAASQVGRAVYMAVRHTHKAGEHAGRTYTYAAVILVFNNARDGFGRKSMSEFSGPCEVDCPARIMALLSPLEEIPDLGSAAGWRADVAAAVGRTTRGCRCCPAVPAGATAQPHRAAQLPGRQGGHHRVRGGADARRTTRPHLQTGRAELPLPPAQAASGHGDDAPGSPGEGAATGNAAVIEGFCSSIAEPVRLNTAGCGRGSVGEKEEHREDGK